MSTRPPWTALLRPDGRNLPIDVFQRSRAAAEAIERLRPRDGRAITILDVGCGDDYLRRFVPGRDRVVLCDRTLVPEKGFVTADATRLPFARGSFDLVVSNDTLEHIPPS